MDTVYNHGRTALRAVRIAHTIVWAFFAGCIMAIPLFAWRQRFDIVVGSGAAVLVEIGVLLFNRWRCPLTGIASRYTDNRQDNFDIYLPIWLARHNKTIFGSIFLAGLLFALARWQRWL
jgi:hypothetical protein